MTQEPSNQAFIGSLEWVIAEVFERMFNLSIPFIFGAWCDAGVCGAAQKLADLFRAFDLLNIHDDVHPAIMDETSLVVETHFILEEAQHSLQPLKGLK